MGDAETLTQPIHKIMTGCRGLTGIEAAADGRIFMGFMGTLTDMNCIIQMRTNRKQQGRDKWRDRLRALFILANGVFFVGWIMGYWSYGTPPWASEAQEDNPDAALADWMRNDPSGGGVGAPEFVQFST